MIELLTDGFLDILNDTIYALFPLIIVLLVMQFAFLKMPKTRLISILRGLMLAFIGLVLFLHGVNIGFINSGSLIGEVIGSLKHNWIIVPIGFVLGFIVTFAEPAVKILNIEVEKITTGYINQKIVLYFLSIGVAMSVALSMIRVLTGISLWYLILPGYIIAMILTCFVSPLFVAIAFDAGGVVTGPMIATFLLAITVSCSRAIEGANPFVDGFGMIAMVSLMPIISILILGLLYERKTKKEVADYGDKRNKRS